MSTEMNNSAKQKVITNFIVFVIISALLVGAKLTTGNEKMQSVATAKPATTTTTTAKAGHYKDGTYTADGTYQSPGGPQVVSVSVTLSGGNVTDATVTGKADGGVAKFYQSSFVGGYKKSVVGKSIDSIRLSRVAGSSLTSNGFNAAIKKIKQQAA